MAQPVLVRAYTSKRNNDLRREAARRAPTLPPLSCWAFADILKSADCAELQSAIDGIAHIAAKNRMSLADEYASHLPPLGEITAATSSIMKPHLLRPGGGMRRALTSVPEASSGSSEGSGRSQKRRNIFDFNKSPAQDKTPMRRMRIGRMGRTIPVDTTTAVTAGPCVLQDRTRSSSASTMRTLTPLQADMSSPSTVVSPARSSLHRLLTSANGDNRPQL